MDAADLYNRAKQCRDLIRLLSSDYGQFTPAPRFKNTAEVIEHLGRSERNLYTKFQSAMELELALNK